MSLLQVLLHLPKNTKTAKQGLTPVHVVRGLGPDAENLVRSVGMVLRETESLGRYGTWGNRVSSIEHLVWYGTYTETEFQAAL